VAEASLEFSWWQDPKGYRLSPAAPDTDEPRVIVHPLGIRTGIGPERHRIVRVGGDLQEYKPIERFDGALLYGEFTKIGAQPVERHERGTAVVDIEASKIRGQREALDFVRRFGPVTRDGLDTQQGDDLDTILVHAAAMREMMWFAVADRRKHVVGAQIAPGGRPPISLNAGFVWNAETQRPHLRISPDSLLDALWAALCLDIQGSRLRVCKWCSTPFRVGPGEKRRRADSVFCNDKCKEHWHSINRSAPGRSRTKKGRKQRA
jgi:hypothetical protein